MRLLDVHQMILEEFTNERKRPAYAILSHTWGDGEVSLQDLLTPTATAMAGYSKIKKCCELAIQDGFKYVWIDTCCIDKTSSSELSEAINSMYHWYQSATICYAYLSDVKVGDDPSDPESPFSKSRWFTRGWTLQELLAPNIVIFYDRDWVDIGTKSSLQEDISRITSIPREALSNQPIDEISIAQRMSWAAMRKTTRVEDAAYCLMGIFSVNMPTLYGEGRQAFIRLQYEIMKSSDDNSLFAWASPNPQNSIFQPPSRWTNPEDDTFLKQAIAEETRGSESGLLASSPRQFRYAQGVRRLELGSSKFPFSMTNNGLHIWLPLVRVRISGQEIYQAILSCEIFDGRGPLSIYLKRDASGQSSRILTSIVCTAHNVEYDLECAELYVKEAYPEDIRSSFFELASTYMSECKFHLVENPSTEQGYTLLDYGPTKCWDQKTHTFRLKVIPSRGSFALSYIIIGANNDPTVRAMVVLGVEVSRFNSEHHNSRFCCAVYSEESRIEEALATLRHLHQGNISETHYFDEALGYVNLDRTTKQLPSGYLISIVIRPDPGSSKPSVSIPNYRVMMTFTQSSLPYPSPVNSHVVVNRRSAVPLPMLTIHLNARLAADPFHPKQNWSVKSMLRWNTRILIWTPTERHKSAVLRLPTSGKLHPPILVFHVVDSDIVVELVSAPSDLLQMDWDTALPSYLHETDPTEKATRKRYQLPSDFPLDTETLRIELRRRMLLNDVGHQMLLTFKEDLADVEAAEPHQQTEDVSVPGDRPRSYSL